VVPSDEHDPEFASDPLVQFRDWWDAARATGDPWADAMVLATATPAGRPSARTVVLRAADERGFAFVTDTRSRKAEELAANPRAALVLTWPTTRRQVRVAGEVVPAAEGDLEAWYAGQPPEANLLATVVTQGEVVPGPGELRERLAGLMAAQGDRPVGRPPYGGGYVVVPEEVELWQERPDHVHYRFRYRRDGAAWRGEWLAP
jgi:pyridoxamine 5'-phosphate oxidase